MSKENSFNEWALIELFGHQKIVGKVSEATLAGGAFLRVDVPAVAENKAYTRFYGPGAIYSINPVTEEIIRKINLPRYLTGGTVGIAAASQIMRHMAEADAELMGLKAQLNDYEQRMRSRAMKPKANPLRDGPQIKTLACDSSPTAGSGLVKAIDWNSRWVLERGTSCFYLTNNGWHLLKTCGDSELDQCIANEIAEKLNEKG